MNDYVLESEVDLYSTIDPGIGTQNPATLLLDKMYYSIITDIIPCTHLLEAGAYEGNMSYNIISKMPNCNVIAIEANPYNYENFHKRFIDTSAKYLHCALSNENGSVTFNVQKKINGNDVGLIRGNNSILERSNGNIEYESVTVQSYKIDELFDLQSGDMMTMWLDLEGFAYEVLTGGTETFINTYCIKIEVETKQFWKEQKLDSDIIQLLEGHGFKKVFRDWESPKQYNILFMKESVLTDSVIAKMKDIVKNYYEQNQS